MIHWAVLASLIVGFALIIGIGEWQSRVYEDERRKVAEAAAAPYKQEAVA